MFDFLNFRKSIDGLSGEIQQLRSEIETKKRRREDLATLPLSREELKAGCDEWIDNSSQFYLEGLPASLDFVMRNPLHDIAGREPRSIPFLSVETGGNTGHLQPVSLLYLFRDQIKAGLHRAIDEWPNYPDETGPPRAQRLIEIEELDREIAKLEQQEAELISQADGAGISIAQLAQPRRKGE